jgi:hypothetical protein
MADLKVSIGSEFDNKGFKKAESSISTLTKGAKKLAGTLGVAFSVRAVTRYGIASVKAAAQDEAAQKQLALALKNVGLGRDAALTEGYIQRLQNELGVLDDELRPAYQGLAIAVQDTAEAQRLLLLSLNISKSTGKGLASVTAALSKAYLGNNTALSKLGIGISKADLKSKSFLEITNQLTETFKGAAKTSADSYEGSLNKLTAASNDVQEAIGSGIIDALKLLGKDGNIDTATSKMRNFGNATNDVIVGIGVLLSKIGNNKLFSAAFNTLQDSFSKGPVGTLQRYLQNLGFKEDLKASPKFAQGLPADLAKLQASMAPALKKNNTTVTKNTAAVLKLTDKFDLKKIGLAAALANPNISEDTRNRLRGLQAIENGDAANSIKYGNLVKPNASMANPNATVVNIYPQGNVLTEQDLVTYIQDGLQTQSRRRGGGKLGPLIL